MRIENVKVTLLSYRVPEEKQHRTDLGWVVKHDTTIVEVVTDEGLCGYGTGVGEAEVMRATVDQQLKPLLIGEDPTQIEWLWQKMYSGSRAHLSMERGTTLPIQGRRGLTLCAIAAVDIALWDLWGKVLKQPVCRLLGQSRSSIRAYASGGWAPGDEAEQEMAEYVALGFKAVKMRAEGRDGFSIAKCLRRIRAARRGIGPDVELMVDAHGSLDVATATQLACGMAEHGVTWFEEPVSPDDHDGLAEVRAAGGVPVAAGENEFTRFDFLSLLTKRAVDVIQPDLGIAGGFTEVRRIAALASSFGVRLAPHNWGSGLIFAASLHMTLSAPNCHFLEVSQATNPLVHELFEEPFEIRDGQVYMPDRPGLGYTLRKDLEKRFPYVPGPIHLTDRA